MGAEKGGGGGGSEGREAWTALGSISGCPSPLPPPLQFVEQENQIARLQLSDMEKELKASLATLRERSSLLEDLKDAHRKLQ